MAATPSWRRRCSALRWPGRAVAGLPASASPDWLWTGDDVARSGRLVPQQFRPDQALQRILAAKARKLWVAYTAAAPCGPSSRTWWSRPRCAQPRAVQLPAWTRWSSSASLAQLAFMAGSIRRPPAPWHGARSAAATARLIEGMSVDGGVYPRLVHHPPETPDENIRPSMRGRHQPRGIPDHAQRLSAPGIHGGDLSEDSSR